MSDDLTIAYMMGVEDMRFRLHKQADEIERFRERLAEADEANRRVSDENETLRRAMHDIYEAYAGIDGYLFDESKTYREQIVVGMSKIAAEHKRAAAAIRE